MTTPADGVAELPPGLTPLLTINQLRTYFGVSRWTVYQWVAQGCPTEDTPLEGHRFDLERVKAWSRERKAAESTEAASA